MLIEGTHIRLTQREKRQLSGLTGSSPAHIRTLHQLELFVNAHLVNFPGRSAEEKLLRRMLESFLPSHLQGSQGSHVNHREFLAQTEIGI